MKSNFPLICGWARRVSRRRICLPCQCSRKNIPSRHRMALKIWKPNVCMVGGRRHSTPAVWVCFSASASGRKSPLFKGKASLPKACQLVVAVECRVVGRRNTVTTQTSTHPKRTSMDGKSTTPAPEPGRNDFHGMNSVVIIAVIMTGWTRLRDMVHRGPGMLVGG